MEHVAIFAGGCFWCLDAAFRMMKGVVSVEPGYIGGNPKAPVTYETVCTGQTGHAEAVRIRYAPGTVRYTELLEAFFSLHDPTQLNRQGHDVGTQYRSAIFWLDEAQRSEAYAKIEMLRAGEAGLPIVTALEQAGEFFPAEAYHHDYYAGHAREGYCAFTIAPKLVEFRKQFTQWMKPDE